MYNAIEVNKLQENSFIPTLETYCRSYSKNRYYILSQKYRVIRKKRYVQVHTPEIPCHCLSDRRKNNSSQHEPKKLFDTKKKRCSI